MDFVMGLFSLSLENGNENVYYLSVIIVILIGRLFSKYGGVFTLIYNVIS